MSEDPQNSQNSSENSKAPHLKPYHFQPGQSGNPGGRPKRKPLSELYERMLDNPEFEADVEKAVQKAVRKGQMAMVLQLKEMGERVEGKVSQQVEVSGELKLSLSERLQKARERRNAK